jgi:hypothetical protein
MAQAPRDQNFVPTLLGTSSADGTTPVVLWADPATHRLLTQSSGGVAPSDATYVTLSTNATLTNERVLTGTANQVVITDNGAGSTVVLSLPQSVATSSTPTFASMTLTASSSLTLGTSSSATGGIILKNASNANTATIISGVTSASYSVTWPVAQGGASTFLQNNGSGVLSWAAGASGTVTDVSVVTANGVSGSVATSTTTPAITLTLGAITPTTVNGLTVTSTNGTLTLANGSSLVTSGANSITLTSTGATSVTLPTSGTLVSSVTTANGVSATNTAGALSFTLGAITPSTVNGLTITSSTGTLTITNGKTLSVSNTLTLAGTDSTVMTFPTTSASIARTDAGQTFTGVQVMTSPTITTSLTTGSSTFDLLAATATTINFAGASSAVVNLGGGANAAELRFLEPSGSGTNYTALKAQAQGASITYTLPASVASAGQVLTDAAGNGTLSWATPSSGGDMVVMLNPGEMLAVQGATLAVTSTGRAISMELADATVDANFRGQVKVPAGATSIASMVVYAEARATGNIYAKFFTGHMNTDAESAPEEDTGDTYTTYAVSATLNDTFAITIPAAAYGALTNIDANDIIAVNVLRDSNDANDTYGAAWRILGVLVTFA